MRFVRLLILILFTLSCSVKYSLTGASISPETKTFQVNYFQNNQYAAWPAASPSGSPPVHAAPARLSQFGGGGGGMSGALLQVRALQLSKHLAQ